MRIAAIGGSAGALEALRELLAGVGDADLAIVVTMHLLADQPSLLPQVLGAYTPFAVAEARDKAVLAPRTVLVAPPDYHLLVESPSAVALSRDPAHLYSRPAIDPLFESAADALGARAIGVLLSGANPDGAAGLAAIRAAGGACAVQDPATASAREMPTAGLAACAPDLVADPFALGRWLATLHAPEHR